MAIGRDGLLLGGVAAGFGALGLVALSFRGAAASQDQLSEALVAFAFTALIAAGVLGTVAAFKTAASLKERVCEILCARRRLAWIGHELRLWRVDFSARKLALHVTLSLALCALAHLYLQSRAKLEAELALESASVHQPGILNDNSCGRLNVKSLEFGNGTEFTAISPRAWELNFHGSWYSREAGLHAAREASTQSLRNTGWTAELLSNEARALQRETEILRSQPYSDMNSLTRELQLRKEFNAFFPNLNLRGLNSAPQHSLFAEYVHLARSEVCDRAAPAKRAVPIAVAFRFDGKRLWVHNPDLRQTMLYDLDRNISITYQAADQYGYYDAHRFQSLEMCLAALFAGCLALLSPVFYLRRGLI